MKQIFAIFTVLTAAHFAKADYFACEIQLGKEKHSVEAEYGAREVKVEWNEYVCTAELSYKGILTVEFASPMDIDGNNSVLVRSRSSFARAVLNDYASCTCGLQ